MAERVYVALDLETTGLSAERDSIIEIGAVRIEGNRISDRFATLVNPQRAIPLSIQQLTGIRDEDVSGAPPLMDVLPELLAFVDADVAAVVAHNVAFDLGFLQASGVNFARPALDTFELATILLPGMASYALVELCHALRIPLADAHRALDDTEATAQLFLHLLTCIQALPSSTLQALVESGAQIEWPPLFLFEDSWRQAASQDPDRTPSQAVRMPQRPAWGTVSPLPAAAPPTTLVSPELLDTFLASGGLLAQEMGPEYEERTGQIKMAHCVLQALNAGDHQLIEAGTGVGKSLAYLIPAALWSVANGQRVVIATNTIALQDQLLEKDIPQVQTLLATCGRPPVKAELLKGRSNYLCERRLQVWRSSHRLSRLELTVLAKVLVWLPQTQSGDVSELFLAGQAERAVWTQLCSDGATCGHDRCGPGTAYRDFFLETQAAAEGAHLLIVNHALLMADLATGGRVLPAYDHLILDETHRLEEAITDQLTFVVEWPATQRVLTRLTLEGDLLPTILATGVRRHMHDVPDAIAELAEGAGRAARYLQRFAEVLQRFTRQHVDFQPDTGYAQRFTLDSSMRTQPLWSEVEIGWEQVAEVLGSIVHSVNALVERLEQSHWHAREPEAILLDDLRGLGNHLDDLLQRMESIIFQPQRGHNSVAWLEVTPDDGNLGSPDALRLAAAPLHLGGLVEQELVHAKRTIICTGATLRTGSGFEYIRERLGLWDLNALTIPSPFDYRSCALLYMPSDLPVPNQHPYQQAVEQAIVAAVQASRGNTLVLFTSYAQLRATADVIRGPLDRAGITVLQHGISSRHRLLREFRQSDNAVLLGTRTFWEGIDLPGDQLRCLMIVRLPFAVPSDPLVAARSAEFDDPFNDFTVPDAIIRFRQGFGRLIRRAGDRGVVVLLDSRIWKRRYGQAFLESLPECTQRLAPLSNLGDEIRRWLKTTVENGD